MRRLIQIRDGEAQAQELWLAFLRKHAYYGVGMKANVWEFSGIGRFPFIAFRIPWNWAEVLDIY